MSLDLECQLSPGRHNCPLLKTTALDLGSDPHPLSPPNSALIVITLNEDAAPHGAGKSLPQSAASSTCRPIPWGSGITALLCLSLSLSLLPPFPSLLPLRIMNTCDLEGAILHFCLLLIKAPCSIQESKCCNEKSANKVRCHILKIMLIRSCF